jgi:hypothetical protein
VLTVEVTVLPSGYRCQFGWEGGCLQPPHVLHLKLPPFDHTTTHFAVILYYNNNKNNNNNIITDKYPH